MKRLDTALTAGSIREMRKSRKPIRFDRNLLTWFLLLPGLFLFSFYIWFPMINGMVLSFFHTEGFRPTEFIGLANYITLLGDNTFYIALKNSFFYVLWSILIGYFTPIILALTVNEVVHARGLVRTALYFPSMMPALAALLLWTFMMNPGKGGLFNAFLSVLGIEPFHWLENAHFTIPLIIVMATWKSAGATSLIYVASLQGISQELYEAASLDGAGVWQKLKYITLPGIYNIARLMLIIQVIFVFQILYEPLVATGGGPVNASLSLMLLNYNYTFRDFKVGMSAAVGVLVSLVLVVLSMVYLKASKEKDSY